MRWLIVPLALLMSSCGCSAAGNPESVVTRAEFEQIFPNHNAFYTYEGFAIETHFESRRVAAMFLANVDHETGGLTAIEENPSRRRIYCDYSVSYGCPAGTDAYYGRGPLQLSWNYNYQAAGEALGLDLLTDPAMVSRNPLVAWGTSWWYWNARVPRGTFGGTIRAINGLLECGGKNPAQVQSRVDAYLRIITLLGVDPGGDLFC